MHTASTTFEVEVSVTGSLERADESVGYPGGYVDTGADGLYALRHGRIEGRSIWTRVDLLAGLDVAARNIVLTNINEFLGEDRLAEVLAETA